MDEKKEYKCEICSKFYKNYKSLWKHNHIYHKNKNIQNIQNMENNIQNNIQKSIHNNCNNCNKILSNYFSRWRHEKICCKKNLEEENKEIKK